MGAQGLERNCGNISRRSAIASTPDNAVKKLRSSCDDPAFTGIALVSGAGGKIGAGRIAVAPREIARHVALVGKAGLDGGFGQRLAGGDQPAR